MLDLRAIVFDLDGTLIDSRPDIATACNFALSSMGFSVLSEDAIGVHIGNGARHLCMGAAAVADDDPRVDELLRTFLSFYGNNPVVRTSWMPGALEALDELSSFKLAVCTNKTREVADRVLDAMHALRRFEIVVGGGDAKRLKPAPDPVLLVVQRLHCDPRQVVMVGDSPQDVLAGRAAHARTIAYAGGYTSRAALEKAAPDVIVESWQEVPPIILRWNGQAA